MGFKANAGAVGFGFRHREAGSYAQDCTSIS